MLTACKCNASKQNWSTLPRNGSNKRLWSYHRTKVCRNT